MLVRLHQFDTSRPGDGARLEIAAVLLVSLAVAVSFGFAFSSEWSNQLTYVIAGMRESSPDFLSRDWFATGVTHYHARFASVVAALDALGVLPWALAAGNVAIVTGCLWLLFRIVQSVNGTRPFLAWALCVLLTLGLLNGRTVAGSYLFYDSVEPSTLATLGFFGAMYAHVRGRDLAAGLCLAAGGAFHTNFLLLAFPWFGLAHLLTGRRGLVARGMRTLGPAAVVLAWELPVILRTLGGELSEEVRAEGARLLAEVLAPHHYDARTFVGDFRPFFGWLVIGFAFLPQLGGEEDRRGAFRALYIAATVLLALAFVFTVVVPVEAVTRLFVWRLAPFALLLAHACIAIGVVRTLFEGRLEGRAASVQAVLIAVGLLLFVDLAPSDWRVAAGALVLLAVGLGAGRGLGAWLEGSGRIVAVYALCVAGVLGLRASLGHENHLQRDSFNLVATPGSYWGETRLYEWARETRPDALFLVPPGLSGFRVQARRAVVVDWKGRPMRPDEVLEWHRRMGEVTGGLVSTDLEAMDRAFHALPAARIGELARRYGVDYVVARVAEDDWTEGRAPVFENPKFRVYAAGDFR